MNSDLYFLSQIWINGTWGEVSILISVIHHQEATNRHLAEPNCDSEMSSLLKCQVNFILPRISRPSSLKPLMTTTHENNFSNRIFLKPKQSRLI